MKLFEHKKGLYARFICINGTDKAEEIAALAEKYQAQVEAES
jgi:hypothetical protein